MEKQFELRQLNSTDIFPFSKILSKLGIRDIKSCFNTPEVRNKIAEGNKTNDMAMEVGAEIVFDIVGLMMENLYKIEDDLYKFLAGVSNLTENELRELSPADFTEIIIVLVQKKEFMDFFKVVSKLFK